MATPQDFDRNNPLPDPELKPNVPEFAEKMNILDHVRHQYHPVFLNEAGGPNANGPRQYLGIDLRCPLCRNIQPLGPPGVEGSCAKCKIHYTYTAAKGSCWLWIWRARPRLNLDPEPLPKSTSSGVFIIDTSARTTK